MAKTKKKLLHAPLVITGYVLFGLLLVAVLLSTTLPWSTIFLHPNSIKLNVVIAMVSLTIGALLPMIIGYIIGDTSVKSKSKLQHHFNGILFGLLAYWLMTIFAIVVPLPSELFTDTNARLIAANLIPSVGVAVVASVLAIMHIRSKKAKQDVLEYKPFVVTLVAAVVTVPVFAIINNIVMNSVSVYTFLMPAMTALFWSIAYVSLRKTRLPLLQRIGWATASLSVLMVALFVTNLLESAVASYLVQYSTMEAQTFGGIAAAVVAVTGWVIFWVQQVKVLRSGKK